MHSKLPIHRVQSNLLEFCRNKPLDLYCLLCTPIFQFWLGCVLLRIDLKNWQLLRICSRGANLIRLHQSRQMLLVFSFDALEADLLVFCWNNLLDLVPLIAVPLVEFLDGLAAFGTCEEQESGHAVPI